ncbi:gliding motility-associated C-terminal domain-containing protein [Hyunsoonleella ulvae]|uniref:gliding motility-associated C-terminal domain-containing protein n=1 Tax=Hyunsoonleella ulvae TaxID=2799948 RepID=UPI00193A637D|nr:gliding motility-associated C-terminal domain-containing protein [Hyunsoonleella ulvae]
MLQKLKILIICVVCVLTTSATFAQTENMNFEFGNFDNWILDTGVRPNIMGIDWNPRPAADIDVQIELTSPASPLFDANGLDCLPTALNIPSVYPGGQFSARIGNIEGGRRTARISRTFTVTADETFLQYSYAIVLDDPSHTQEEQPKFVVNIKDATDSIVTCGQFEAFAGPNAADKGFTRCERSNYQILPWTTAGADLTPFIGQQITIEFLSLDCTRGAHGGYAYVEASLQPLEIQVENLCVSGDTITLTAPLGFTEYLWSNGETTRSITVTNAQFGDMYSVDLISNTGCNSSASITLEPVEAATIDAIPDQEICLGGNAFVQPTGTNFGDFRYVIPDPANPGNFNDVVPPGISAVLSPTVDTTYTVIARDENGCDGPSTTFTVTVLQSNEPPFPTADFEIEPVITADDNPCNTIQLINLSGYCKGGLSYLWDFGDGTTSTEVEPLHTFPLTTDEETYVITLTVTAADGLTDSKSLEYTTSSITAQFSTLPPDCETVTLTNTSRICGASIADFPSFVYTWDFGDGSPNTTTDNSEVNVTHNYTVSGMYTITLTISNTDNPSLSVPVYTDTVDITVETNVDFNLTIDCFDVTFEDISTLCDPIVSLAWDFGDGSPISSEAMPTHTYTTIGPHSVTLTINDGSQDFSQTLDVFLSPSTTLPDFEFEINCEVVNFTDLTNSCNDLSYQWDFGDGSPLNTSQNPSHTYAPDTTYDVTLTVNDGTEDFSITKSVALVSPFMYETPQDLIGCAEPNMPNVATFDLAAQRDFILQNVAPDTPEFPVVSFHNSAAEAEMNTGALPLEFMNASNPQTLHVRVEDNDGCTRFFSFSLSVFDTPIVNAVDDIFLCYLKENTVGYDLSQLNARVFEGIEQSNINLSYHLFENDALLGENDVTQINLNAGIDTTIYVRAENAMANVCFSISTFLIRMDNENTDVEDRCMPFFANTMTPNGDGANDTFFIKNIETFPNNRLTIYNRWGNIVYEASGYNNSWGGTYKGEPLPVGNYYYYMELNDNDNRSHSGYITILR